MNANLIDNFYFDKWKKTDLKIFADKNSIQLSENIKKKEIIVKIKQNLTRKEKVNVFYPVIDNLIKLSITSLTSKKHSLTTIISAISIIVLLTLLWILSITRNYGFYFLLYFDLATLSIAYIFIFVIFILNNYINIFKYIVISQKDMNKINLALINYYKNNALIKDKKIYSQLSRQERIARLTKRMDNYTFQKAFIYCYEFIWLFYLFFIIFYPIFVYFIIVIILISIIVFSTETFRNVNTNIIENYISYYYQKFDSDFLKFSNTYDPQPNHTSLENLIKFINEINELLNFKIFGRVSDGVDAWNIPHKRSNLKVIQGVSYKIERFLYILAINKPKDLEANQINNLNNMIKSFRNELEFEINKLKKVHKTDIFTIISLILFGTNILLSFAHIYFQID